MLIELFLFQLNKDVKPFRKSGLCDYEKMRDIFHGIVAKGFFATGGNIPPLNDEEETRQQQIHEYGSKNLPFPNVVVSSDDE